MVNNFPDQFVGLKLIRRRIRQLEAQLQAEKNKEIGELSVIWKRIIRAESTGYKSVANLLTKEELREINIALHKA